jgi:ADP-heptose:LPS heptosyltransferase
LPSGLVKKLILKNCFALGDIVTLTAAVRDLHRCYPGMFLTDVRTSCKELWENNPYLTPLLDDDPEVEIIECLTPLINRSNSAPYHYLHGFISFLNERLQLKIEPTAFRGDIHISAREKAWFSQVHELTGEDTPFWIVSAGGKYDLTIKWWSLERYQQVIDHFRGKIQFVQVGAKGHFHPKLKGSIDLRGQTDIRQLVRLVYHAQGVLCGVTGLMHLAAAVPTKNGIPKSRPCVVVAGGREPAHWEAYPDHQYIATNGALRCCSGGGCWRARTAPLGDGDERDRAETLCVDIKNDLPRCMDLIPAGEVIRRIELYFNGGIASYLNSSQCVAARRGVKASRQNSYDETALTLHNARIMLEQFVPTISEYPGGFSGRGIVICAGGVRYFTNAWVCVRRLRQLGCALPIEFWHRGPGEMDSEMKALVEPLGVGCVDVNEVMKKHPVRRMGGWELKPYAILHTTFREVMLLDADNFPVINPEFLFETPQFIKTGAIFWPDLGRFEKSQIIWDSCGLERPETPEFESGQIVVDKERCWAALRLSLWFNEHSDFYYQHLHGDKETFHLAFHKVRKSYAMVPTPVKHIPATMCQHDFDGRRILQHRNMDKWNLFLLNRRIADFWDEEEARGFVRELREKWDGGAGTYVKKKEFRALPSASKEQFRIVACMLSCSRREEIRNQTLKNLAQTDWDEEPVAVQLDAGKFSSPEDGQTETARLALESCLHSNASHVLFLEDDLEFNRHIRHNLSSWVPLRKGVIVLASLYNPGMRAWAWNARENYSLCNPHVSFGSQAYVLSKHALKYILNHWNEVKGKQDLRITRLAARLQTPMFYHTPSLVQHVGENSTWGGKFHLAPDYDSEWRAQPV